MTDQQHAFKALKPVLVDTNGQSFRSVTPDTILDSLPFGVCLLTRDDHGNYRTYRSNRYLLNITQTSELCQFNPLDESFTPLTFDPAFIQATEVLDQSEQDEVRFAWHTASRGVPHILACTLQRLSNQKISSSYLLTINDHTSNALSEQQAIHDAFHDGLTRLPNLAMLKLRMGEWLDQRNGRDSGAVLIVNLNRFQTINESLGYLNGDLLLGVVSDRLKITAPGNSVIARIGGDEFAIFLPHFSKAEAESLARHIHHQLAAPFTIDDHDFTLTASIGITITSAEDINPEDMVRNASIAMHRAKQDGDAATVVYHDELKVIAKSRFEFEGDLRRALERRELSLQYQPIYSLTSGELIGFEALCRWIHPERGFIPPSDFIPVAENCGLIVPLGRWALNEACQQLADWSRRFPQAQNLSVNVNVSGIQIARDNLLEAVGEALTQSGFNGERLRLEITESALMTNADLAADLLLDLKSYGVCLALDDFGTGYSSLNYLSRFPIDSIKIDRSFIANLDNSPDDYKIVHIITLLANTLGITAVAEGIETADQLERLKALGCHYGQGYHFARPLTVESVEEKLFASAMATPPMIAVQQLKALAR